MAIEVQPPRAYDTTSHPHDAVWDNMRWDYGEESTSSLYFDEDSEDPEKVRQFLGRETLPAHIEAAIERDKNAAPGEAASLPIREYNRRTLGMLALIGGTRRSAGYVTLTEESGGLDMLLERGDSVAEIFSKAAGSSEKVKQFQEKFDALAQVEELVKAGFSREDAEAMSRAMAREMEQKFFGSKKKNNLRTREKRKRKKHTHPRKAA